MADNDKKGKGFAGFDSMVSDIEDDLKALAPSNTDPRSEHSPKGGSAAIPPRSTPTVADDSPRAVKPQAPPPAYSGPTKKTGGSSAVWGWIIGIGVVIAIVNSVGKSSSSSSQRPSSPPPSSASYTPSSPAPAYESESTAEQIPAVGSGQILSANEIRYCVSEDVRIATMKGMINSYSQYEIDQFNALVTDYNSRCSNFRYKKGVLEAVRTTVEAKRPSLAAEARNVVLVWRNSATNAYTPPVQPSSVAPAYYPPTYSPPLYVPPANYGVDQAAINQAMEEGRQALSRMQAATRVCGQFPTDMRLMDAHMACMERQGAY